MAMAFLQSGDVRFPAPWLLFILLSFFFADEAWAVVRSPGGFVYTRKKCNCPQLPAKSLDRGVVCLGVFAVRPSVSRAQRFGSRLGIRVAGAALNACLSLLNLTFRS